MKTIVCALRDEVSASYVVPPSFELSERHAIRNFESSFLAARSRQVGLFFTHPEDYSLYMLGEFDDEEGTFSGCTPKLLRKGSEVNDQG